MLRAHAAQGPLGYAERRANFSDAQIPLRLSLEQTLEADHNVLVPKGGRRSGAAPETGR